MIKSSTQDKTAGKLHELKGAIRQKAGELTKNHKLEANGMAEKNAGKVQNAIARSKRPSEHKRINTKSGNERG